MSWLMSLSVYKCSLSLVKARKETPSDSTHCSEATPKHDKRFSACDWPFSD